MAVRSKNAHWKLKDIQPRHWKGVAREAGMSDAAELIEEVVSLVPSVLSKVAATLPSGFPERISGKIFAGIEAQARRLGAD